MPSTDQLQKVLSEGLANSGVDPSKISSMMNTDTLTSTMGNLQQMASDQLKSLQGKADSLFGASIDSIASSFPDAAKQLFSQVNPQAGMLGSLGDLTKGPKETDDKLQSLASDSAEAIASPVSFVTKPINDAIKGIDTQSKGMGVKDLLSGMDSFDISNISKSVGFNITSSSDMSKAISSVTNSLSGQIRDIPSMMSSLSSSIGAPITSSLKDFQGGLMSGIKEIASSVSSSTGLGELLSAGSNLTGSALSILPPSVRSAISYSADSFLINSAQSILGDKMGSYANILGMLTGTSLQGSLFNNLLSLGDSSGYPMQTDQYGKPLFGSVGNNSSNDINALYKAAMTICSGINNPTYMNYRQNKDLYDILMMMAASMGLTDLMRQLQNCAGGQASYYDSRTTSLLQGSTRSVATQGNPYAYAALQDILGPSNVRNPKQDVIILNANMKGTPSNIQAYNGVLSGYGYTSSDLLMNGRVGSYPVYSGQNTALMSASNTNVVDAMIGSGVRSLIQGALFSYS